jgi:amino-acid N-acetyltransferase
MIREARVTDVPAIGALIEHYARQGLLLPKPLGRIYEALRTFVVWEEDGRVLGCGRLDIVWEDLAEVGSLAVHESLRGRGAGTAIVEALVEEARDLGIPRLFALTYQVRFFEKIGFQVIPKQDLPHKIWKDCLGCAKYDRCDEVAMQRVLEEVPRSATPLAPTAADFGLSGFARMPRPAPARLMENSPGAAQPPPAGRRAPAGGAATLPGSPAGLTRSPAGAAGASHRLPVLR